MAQKFALSVVIQAPLTQIYEYLTDITLLGADHPLAIKYAEITPETLPSGQIRRHFRVTDRIKLGFLWITTRYRVTTTIHPDGSVRNEAFQSPGIHLTIRYQFAETPLGIQVSEKTIIAGPPILQRIATRQAYLAHKILLDGIKERLEAANRGGH